MPPKTASQTPNDDLDTEIALFRYGLIAQILHDPPPAGQQETLLRAIAAKCYRIPGSTCLSSCKLSPLHHRIGAH